MKQIIYFLGLITLGSISFSCDKDSENILPDGQEEAFEMDGIWEVNAYNDTTFVFGPFGLTTSDNLSTGNDSLTVKDTDTKFWNFQAKVATDETAGTFQTKLSYCELCEESIGIRITNGKVDGDSIYLEIQFEDDETPYGNTYQLKGHRMN